MLPATCSHGKTWDEECARCSAVSMCESMRFLIRDCARVASALEAAPGLASDPRVVIDLYNTVSRLAKTLCNAQTVSGES